MNNADFASQPTYTQTTKSNETWVAVTLTKTEPDGSTAQSQAIISKR